MRWDTIRGPGGGDVEWGKIIANRKFMDAAEIDLRPLTGVVSGSGQEHRDLTVCTTNGRTHTLYIPLPIPLHGTSRSPMASTRAI